MKSSFVRKRVKLFLSSLVGWTLTIHTLPRVAFAEKGVSLSGRASY
jgi:hypothetical protein